MQDRCLVWNRNSLGFAIKYLRLTTMFDVPLIRLSDVPGTENGQFLYIPQFQEKFVWNQYLMKGRYLQSGLQKSRMLESRIPASCRICRNFGQICRQIMQIYRQFYHMTKIL